jgi:translation initiation factor 1A
MAGFIRDRDRPLQPGEPIRVRLPRAPEMLGEIEQILGASRFKIACKDGKTRLCRIPGKFRRRIKVMVGDIVIVKPWEIEGDEKGDIVWIYNKTQMNWLRNKGYV